MRLNLKKCVFRVRADKFLGFMLIERGIKANLTKCQAITNMKSPANVKEVQALNGRLATLTKFMFRLVDNCAFFFDLLKNNKTFEWTDECEKAFKELKEYLVTSPILTRLEPREVLHSYLAALERIVSFILVKEEGNE